MATCSTCGAHSDHWIKSAVKHPGAETAAAKKHGLSTHQEAIKESHSSNPHIRARGLLAKRFTEHKS
jgi:hypothetical protein